MDDVGETHDNNHGRHGRHQDVDFAVELDRESHRPDHSRQRNHYGDNSRPEPAKHEPHSQQEYYHNEWKNHFEIVVALLDHLGNRNQKARPVYLGKGKSFVLGMQQTDSDLAVYVDSGESAAPAIMRLLSNDGIEVSALSVSRPALDDVFLKYTGHTIRAQEGQATTYAQMRRQRDRRQR